MKKWEKPELNILGIEETESSFKGSHSDGVFIEVHNVNGEEVSGHVSLIS